MPGPSRREGRSGAAGLTGRLRGEEGLTDQAGLAAGGRAARPALPLSRLPKLSTDSPASIAVHNIALQPCTGCITT